MLNSSTATCPPGRQTRVISARPRSVSATFRRPKATRDDGETIVLKRQVLGVGFDERQLAADLRPRLLAAADLQHLAAEVGARRFPTCRPSPGERPVPDRPCRCRHRGSARPACGCSFFDRPPPPVAIDVERQQVVHAVVVRRDLAEHPLHPLARFVDAWSWTSAGEQISWQTRSRRPGDVKSLRLGRDAESDSRCDRTEVITGQAVATIRPAGSLRIPARFHVAGPNATGY